MSHLKNKQYKYIFIYAQFAFRVQCVLISSVCSEWWSRLFQRFRFPLSITMVHLTTKFIIASVVRWCLYRRSGKERIVLPWSLYVKCILPPGNYSNGLAVGLCSEYTSGSPRRRRCDICCCQFAFNVFLRVELETSHFSSKQWRLPFTRHLTAK